MSEQNGNSKPNEAEGLTFPLSDNEKLIEEALVAYWGGAMNAHVHGSVAGMRAAFGVFEKALTPTDDEREAPESTSDVARIIDRAMRPWGLSNIGTHSAARALISAGYRRFEAQQ